MSIFNYRYWFGRMSDTGFQHCLTLLFPRMNYQYMEEKDVRRIDLCERMYDLTSRQSMFPGCDSGSTYQAYLKALNYYIRNFLACTPNSNAEQYRNRALAIIQKYVDRYEKDKTVSLSTDEWLTVFSVYLGLSRQLYPKFAIHMAEYINPLVCENDAELLLKLRDFPFKKGLAKQPQEEKNIIYMHNVIMYCLLMDAQGEYDEED